MYKRKLLALDYPIAEPFDVNDDDAFRGLILWLEDQKIRHYKIVDRTKLRDLTSSDWDAAYIRYLNDLACPITSKIRSEEVEWILAFAVRLEHGDNVEKYKNQTATIVAQQASVPKVVSTNVLDNLDFQSPDFIQGVQMLATLLKITPHPDHLVTLEAISKMVTTRLSQEALDNPASVIVKGTPFPFEEADLGFDMGDYVLNQAAKIFRLLYINNLRQLQTQVNECIVAVQTVTANPKTDTKLGQVGR